LVPKLGWESSELTREELERYDRQIRVLGLGVKGQEKLKASKAVVAGLGGLGCSASTYLAAAGVGNLLLIDREKVELSNLNRQVLHWTRNIEESKADSASSKLRELNPTIKIEALTVEIREDNVHSLVKGADVVLDGQDNFKTRFALNRACVDLGIPFVHAAVHGLECRLMTVVPRKGPCLRCLLATEPPEIRPIPVIGAVAATAACLQAIEAIKVIVDVGDLCVGRMMLFDGERFEFDVVKIQRRPNCPVCGSAS